METPAGAADRWDATYRRRAGSTTPAAILDEIADLVPSSGSVVDLAGGSGANALWFAARGLDVTVVDVSTVGLELAATTAADAGLRVDTLHRDIEADGLPDGQRWDVVFMHLFLDRAAVLAMPTIAHPGGLLVFAQPTVQNLERHPRPGARFLLREGEIEQLAEALQPVEVLRADAEWRSSGRHEGWLIARMR